MKGLKDRYVFYCNSIKIDGNSHIRSGLGGSESALIYISRELHRLGNEVMVFCDTDNPGIYNGVIYEKIDKFGDYVEKNIIDVFISVRSADIFLYPVRAGKYVLWLHDDANQPHMQALYSDEIRDKIDIYITVSDWQRMRFVEKFGIDEEKIFLSRNGINRKFFKTYKKRRKKRIVYTSTPFRGLDILLDIFPEIRKRVPDAELCVYSSMSVYGMNKEDDYAAYGDLYERCNRPGVRLIGSISQEKLAKELMKAEVLVYPNIFEETSCIAALEAQAAGLAVVSVAKGALPETVENGKSGILIEEDILSDAGKEKFVKEITSLLNDKERRENMGAYGRERVLSRFCWDTIASEWDNYFKKIRPTLSLCMIVKNESKYLSKAVNSVRSIVDEIIVVDTGSEDDTVDVAKSLGAKVFFYEWNDDFSAARNFSISKATSDWILVLDADESVSEKDLPKIRKFLNLRENAAYRFMQRSYLDDAGVVGWKPNDGADDEGRGYGGYFDSPLTRLFRNGCGFKFSGKVHEVVEPSILRKGKNIITTNIPIHHFGKVRSERKMAEKGELYLNIGKEKIKREPDNPNAYYELGAQCFELNMFGEAKKYYEKALEIDSRHYRALCDLGLITAREGDYFKAEELLLKSIEINENYVSAYINLGIVCKELGKFDEAEKYLEKALKLDPKNVSAYKYLGKLFYKTGLYEEAFNAFSKMKKYSSEFSATFEYGMASYHIGLTLLNEKKYGDSKVYFEEALKYIPDFVSAYNNYGVALTYLGDLKNAEEAFLKVLELSSIDNNNIHLNEVAKAYVNLGYIFNNKGDFKKAVYYLEKGLECDGANPEIYNHLGIARCGMGDLRAGVKFFEMALKIDHEHGAAATNLKRVKEALVGDYNREALGHRKD